MPVWIRQSKDENWVREEERAFPPPTQLQNTHQRAAQPSKWEWILTTTDSSKLEVDKSENWVGKVDYHGHSLSPKQKPFESCFNKRFHSTQITLKSFITLHKMFKLFCNNRRFNKYRVKHKSLCNFPWAILVLNKLSSNNTFGKHYMQNAYKSNTKSV